MTKKHNFYCINFNNNKKSDRDERCYWLLLMGGVWPVFLHHFFRSFFLSSLFLIILLSSVEYKEAGERERKIPPVCAFHLAPFVASSSSSPSNAKHRPATLSTGTSSAHIQYLYSVVFLHVCVRYAAAAAMVSLWPGKLLNILTGIFLNNFWLVRVWFLFLVAAIFSSNLRKGT